MYKMQIKLRLEWCVFSFSLSLIFLSFFYFFFPFSFLRKEGIWFFSPHFSLRCLKLKRKGSVVKCSLKGSNSNWFFTSSRSKSGYKDPTSLGYFLHTRFFPRGGGGSDWHGLCCHGKSNSLGFRVEGILEFLWHNSVRPHRNRSGGLGPRGL